ncbi:MAG: KEOPS complex subunit Pcc1 [Haloferacaceae archaeon]
MSDRRARVRTEHADPETVAAALRPDDTPSMRTRVAGGTVLTEIERDGTGGLRTTLDDYLVNVRVAERVVRAATAATTADGEGDDDPTADGEGDDDPDDGIDDERRSDTTDTHDT